MAVLVKLGKVDAVVEVVDLGKRDFVFPVLFFDVVRAALHGKDQAVGVFVEPLLEGIQCQDDRIFAGHALVFDNRLRPDIPHLHHAGHLEALGRNHRRGRREDGRRGGVDDVRPLAYLGKTIYTLLNP